MWKCESCGAINYDEHQECIDCTPEPAKEDNCSNDNQSAQMAECLSCGEQFDTEKHFCPVCSSGSISIGTKTRESVEKVLATPETDVDSSNTTEVMAIVVFVFFIAAAFVSFFALGLYSLLIVIVLVPLGALISLGMIAKSSAKKKQLNTSGGIGIGIVVMGVIAILMLLINFD